MSTNFTTAKRTGGGQHRRTRRQPNFFVGLYFFLCLTAAAIGLACQPARTDLRALAPADTLVYLETDDLGRMLRVLTETRAFQEAAKSKPDFSPLEGIQTAIAVVGFETFERPVTPESAVLDFRPHFVAIADTHAWNWQARSFAENQLGRFVSRTYGGEAALETAERAGGKFFTWTAPDGRRAHAFVRDSQVFFSNNEAALEKCLAVVRGESESLAQIGRTVEKGEPLLAAGFVSAEGIAQIANLAGVSLAIETTDEDEGRSFIARVLPQVLRGSIREITWTAVGTEQGVEDRYSVSLTNEVASVVSETLVPGPPVDIDSAEFLPAGVTGATRYQLENPQIAWRSVLLTTARQTDPASAKILMAFSGSFFEPYGIVDAESFLSAVESEIWTVQMDAEGERRVVVARVKDAEKLKKSLTGMNFQAPPESRGEASLWKSEEDELAAAFVAGKIILGDAESVQKCLEARQSGQNLTKNPWFAKMRESRAVAVTFGRDESEKIVGALGEKKADNLQLMTYFLTETRLTERSVERRTISPFGLIGEIIERLAPAPA